MNASNLASPLLPMGPLTARSFLCVCHSQSPANPARNPLLNRCLRLQTAVSPPPSNRHHLDTPLPDLPQTG
jgi:hypothetical protein